MDYPCANVILRALIKFRDSLPGEFLVIRYRLEVILGRLLVAAYVGAVMTFDLRDFPFFGRHFGVSLSNDVVQANRLAQ